MSHLSGLSQRVGVTVLLLVGICTSVEGWAQSPPAAPGYDSSLPWVGYWSLDFAAGVLANPRIPAEQRPAMAAEYANSPMTLRLDPDGTYEVTIVMEGEMHHEWGTWEPVSEEGLTMSIVVRNGELLPNGQPRVMQNTLILDGPDSGTCVLEEVGHRLPMQRIQDSAE